MDTAWIGVIGGAVGGIVASVPTYLGARLAASAQLSTALIQGQATIGQLREQQDQRNLEHRQSVYHQFSTTVWRLTAVMDMAWPAVQSGEILDEEWTPVRDELATLLDGTRHLFEGLRLFGSEDVQKWAEHLDTVYFARSETDLRLALLLGDPAGLRADHIRDLFEISFDSKTIERWSADLWSLREAMRADVGRAAR